jgi:hypothetical protein
MWKNGKKRNNSGEKPLAGAIKNAVFSIIRCIIAYLSVRVVSLKEKPKVIIRVCRPFI